MDSIKDKLEADLKQAMLARNKVLTTTLRGLKSVILYDEVAKGVRDTGLSDAEIIDLFVKEAKKRQESADMYSQGGNDERAEAELAEKTVIDNYLPRQLDDGELAALVGRVIESIGPLTSRTMGQVIGKVKQESQGRVEGIRVAETVRKRLGAMK